jgi:(p)ppGpp synthase/HD superfamily hydrolase
MDILEKVREFADNAHGEQKRKYSGDRYIVHPVRVMNICRQYTQNPIILAAALLHDVLEDTPVGKEKIYHFLEDKMTAEEAAEVVNLVTALTDVYIKESFPHLNRKNRKSKESARLGMIPGDAQTIKYADIIDNTIDITQNDPGFALGYLKECRSLLNNITKGNPALYKKAIESVEECMRKITNL